MSGEEAGSGRRRRVEGGERNGTARDASLRRTARLHLQVDGHCEAADTRRALVGAGRGNSEETALTLVNLCTVVLLDVTQKLRDAGTRG